MPGKLLRRSTTRGAQAALALAILLATGALAPSQAPGAAPPEGPAMRVAEAGAMDLGAGRQAPGEAIVRYEPGVAPAERRRARARAAVELGRRLELPRAELVEVEGSVQVAIRRLERQPGIAYAQPNYRYEALADPPDDTFFDQLWGLSAPPAFGVNALAAWDSSRGAGVTIAVLDTGVDLTHPDLAGNLWHNPGETKNGADSDGNGKVDDVHGYDFIDDNGDPDDYQFHGTHVAGTAAAIAGNGLGIAGVAPEAEIMSVRVLDGNGFGFSSEIADGIAYAALEGAEVVNLSLGGPAGAGDHLVEGAITLAAGEGAVVVAAAGNDGADNDIAPTTPCTLPNANLICVAAITKSGGFASFSNFGASTVDVGAPGTGILSAIPSYGPPILSEGFDSPTLSGWNRFAEGDSVEWGASSTIFSAGTHSAADSPGGNYAPDSRSWLYKSNAIDLADERGCRMRFDLRRDIKPPDWLFTGAITSEEGVYDGRFFTGSSGGAFRSTEASISFLDGRPDVFPAFLLSSNNDGIEGEGAYVDELDLVCRDASYVDAIGANGYAFFNGTSMATPHVAGVAALVRAAAPEATLGQVVDAILEGVRPVPSLKDKTVTGGIVDADLAIEAVLQGEEEPPPGPEPEPDPEPEPEPEPAPEPEPTAPAPAPVSEQAFVGSSVGPWVGFVQRPGRVVRTAKRWAWGKFRFRSGEGGVAFICKIDRRPYRRCGSRLVRRFGLGRHVVRVKARDAAGNVTRRPAIHRFRIVRIGRR